MQENNKIISLNIEDLEKEIANGKNYVLLEPIHDSKMNVLIGTTKILTLKDIEKIRERCPEVLKNQIKVKHTVPHYVDEEKRVQWIDYIVAQIDKNDLFKSLQKDCKDFIAKYIKLTLKDNDYIIWKLSQLKTFSKKIFEHTIFTSFISILAYRAYCSLKLQGMINGSEIEKVIEASLLHSIGLTKYNVSFVEQKRVDIENSEENISFFQYPIESMRIINSEKERHEISEEVIEAILNHNEYLDGTGNPRGIGGEDISLIARVVGASHYFELLLRGEYTLKAREAKFYLERLKAMKGKLDPDVVEAICKSFKHIFANATKEFLSNH